MNKYTLLAWGEKGISIRFVYTTQRSATLMAQRMLESLTDEIGSDDWQVIEDWQPVDQRFHRVEMVRKKS